MVDVWLGSQSIKWLVIFVIFTNIDFQLQLVTDSLNIYSA